MQQPARAVIFINHFLGVFGASVAVFSLSPSLRDEKRCALKSAGYFPRTGEGYALFCLATRRGLLFNKKRKYCLEAGGHVLLSFACPKESNQRK